MLDVRVENYALHIGKGFTLVFQRTLRIPDDDKTYPLPPGLGRFPVCRVEDYQDRVPASWKERGGVFIPMYQREALWLFFGSVWPPRAVKVAVGKINAVTGKPWDDCVRHYIADPAGLPHLGFGRCQRSLDGFANAYWLSTGPAMVAGRDLADDFEAVRNSPVFFDSLVPGGGLVTDAGTLAAFYDIHLADGVTHHGKRLLRSETLRRYQRREVFVESLLENNPHLV